MYFAGLPFVHRVSVSSSSLGQIFAKLKKGYYEDSLIIVASKHGQAPIDPKLWNEVDPDALMNATSKPVAWLTMGVP